MSYAVFKNYEFYSQFDQGKEMIFGDLVDQDTRDDFVYTFHGKVLKTPNASKFGATTFLIALNDEESKIIKDTNEILKCPLTKGYITIKGYYEKDDQKSIWFKLPHDSHGQFKASTYKNPQENWEGDFVAVRTKINTYYNTTEKRCGLYFTVKDISLVKDSTK